MEKQNLSRWAKAYLCLLGLSGLGQISALASLGTDIAYDRTAQGLELIRNQIELAYDNHESVKNDVQRQQRELESFGVFIRIPKISQDLKSDTQLETSIQENFQRVRSGYELRKIRFKTKWKSESKKIPSTIAFDENYKIPDGQLVDERILEVEFEFQRNLPKNLQGWFQHEQEKIHRLLVSKNSWKKSGRRISGSVAIYRFREIEFPKLVAPDLAKFNLPSNPESPTQKAAAMRAERYRRDIVEFWPKVQPYLDDVRAFALNDLRMNFFLKHANSSH